MRVLILLLLLACPAQAAELKVATWNLNWLTLRPGGDPALPQNVHPRPAEAFARLGRYAALLNADVVALQEIDGREAAARLFPPDRYALHLTQDEVVQRVGFAIRRGIPFHANPDVQALTLGGRLRSGADVTLDLPGGPLRLLAVHLKSGCREDRLVPGAHESCGTLGTQLAPLQAWIAARRDEGTAFLLLGDFNRWMDHNDAFWAGLSRIAPMDRATTGKSSPCWGGGGFIDHVIAGGPARAWLVPDSLRVLVYREKAAAWKETLSDHCPVSVLMRPPS